MAALEVRPAVEPDLPAVNDIYNHYVERTHVTFDVDPVPLDERRRWFTHYGTIGRHRLLVAVDAGTVVGYATSSPFKDRRAYETSVETSVYVSPAAVGHGVGMRLYDELFAVLRGEDLHRAYGGIALPNPGSITLHERCGFRRVALYSEVGRKFGRYWDVAWYEKLLD